MEAFNSLLDITKYNGITETKVWREVIETYLILLAPICPYLTEEMWEHLGHKKSIHMERWPIGNEKLMLEDLVNIPIQVNGRLRHVISVKLGTPEEEIQKLALQALEVKKYTDGHEIIKVIVPKGKLVSIVTK